ncbi:unnamed protein product, partial [Mesorhabditis spiculigera]
MDEGPVFNLSPGDLADHINALMCDNLKDSSSTCASPGDLADHINALMCDKLKVRKERHIRVLGRVQ